MKKGDVIKRIIESTRLNEDDQAYYIKMYISGNFTEEELKWIWE